MDQNEANTAFMKLQEAVNGDHQCWLNWRNAIQQAAHLEGVEYAVAKRLAERFMNAWFGANTGS